MDTTFKFVSLTYTQTKTYLFAALFLLGNILLPQLCHCVELGGPTWLPIYFFTLIGAYKYGMRLGLLVAVLSPLLLHMHITAHILCTLNLFRCKSLILHML